MTRERDDTGQYVETVGLEDVLEVFESVRGPAITSSDIADALDCTTEAARQKLTRLYDRGLVDKRKSGRTVIYWRTDGRRESDVTPSNPAADVSPVEPTATRERDDTDLEQRMRDALEELDVVGRGAETEEVRRDAIAFAWEQLRDAGEATTQELANAAFDEYGDHPRFGYSPSENHYRGYTFWDSCARDVLKELPGVESPPQRGNTWRFSEADGVGGKSKSNDTPASSGVYDPTEEF